MAFGDFMNVGFVVQTILFYGFLAFALWIIVRIAIDTREIKNQLAEIRKALEGKG